MSQTNSTQSSTPDDALVTVEILPDTGWAVLRLNRPKALQALNTDMVIQIKQQLEKIADDASVYAIWFESNTHKAFCAGGDVRAVRQSVLEDDVAAGDAFFEHEYALDLYLHEYRKPIVVWAEGYIMGGGMGMMMACPFRIMTPKSKVAMPEVSIGLFPDVGASRFLAERDQLGLFLGMTGAMLNAADSYLLRFATHLCAAEKNSVFERLLSIKWSADKSAHRAIDDALEAIHTPMLAMQSELHTACGTLEALNLGNDFAQDYAHLCTLATDKNTWLKQAGESISQGSPASAALTWLLWQWGRRHFSDDVTADDYVQKNWQQVFALEEAVVAWKIRHEDFAEGVRARLVDKDLTPAWQQASENHLSAILPTLPKTDDATWQHLLQTYGIQAV